MLSSTSNCLKQNQRQRAILFPQTGTASFLIVCQRPLILQICTDACERWSRCEVICKMRRIASTLLVFSCILKLAHCVSYCVIITTAAHQCRAVRALTDCVLVLRLSLFNTSIIRSDMYFRTESAKGANVICTFATATRKATLRMHFRFINVVKTFKWASILTIHSSLPQVG